MTDLAEPPPEDPAEWLPLLRSAGTWLLPQSRISVWVFLRLLGLVNIIAFASCYVQVDALIGSQGIIPAAHFLDQVKVYQGDQAARVLPTLCWLSCSDTMLHGLCLMGIVAGICLTLGFYPWLFTLVCWVNYLSLTNVGQAFFSFQWDALLLEVNLVALFLVPLTSLRLRGPRHTRYHRVGLALLYLLLFKLMFSSGIVKINSKDPTWADLTAMEYHYETQPLPLASAWYAHKLPADLQKASTFAMFIIELLFPFAIFLPRLFRNVAGIGLVLLQLLIMSTGNYTFFNLLAIALCLLLFDDQSWSRVPKLKPLVDHARTFDFSVRRVHIRRWIVWPLAAVLGVLLLAQTASTGLRKPVFSPGLQAVKKVLDPYRSTNPYGLFAIMTTTRPEIILQGSIDGVEWLDYEFKYKPGDLSRRPRLVAPHQPRLDWQCWFAALAWDYPQPWTSQPWMLPFVERLLEGESQVLDLLETNPFPDRPPRYVRAMTYDYTFTSQAERRESGNWWKREFLKPYFPSVSLRNQ